MMIYSILMCYNILIISYLCSEYCTQYSTMHCPVTFSSTACLDEIDTDRT